ncbi:hypothetical protein MTR67_012976 [Solanum verrucosum]|uniref:Uncharacterized protein n=1 Tax=Solanum verrucosum TaxID=315347 RepID=A0AAF0QA88_SOLVR|nr:hypothetical protein MTR67_012976 [Solanum verrucosum]
MIRQCPLQIHSGSQHTYSATPTRDSAAPVGGRGRCQSCKGGKTSRRGATTQLGRSGYYSDWRSTFSHMSTYFVVGFDMMFDSIPVPIHFSTLVGDSLVVDRLYRSYLVSLAGYDTWVFLKIGTDLSINLEPVTKPISISLCRMDLAKLKELKDQLQDLLSKGFIRLSVSPWGASVLFLSSCGGPRPVKGPVVHYFWAGVIPRIGRRTVVPFTVREPYLGSPSSAVMRKVMVIDAEVISDWCNGCRGQFAADPRPQLRYVWSESKDDDEHGDLYMPYNKYNDENNVDDDDDDDDDDEDNGNNNDGNIGDGYVLHHHNHHL